MQENLHQYLSEANRVIAEIQVDETIEVISVIFKAWKNQKRIFLLGNGGSASLASHFACDLNKTAIVPGRQRFRAISLTDNLPILTSWANDSSYKEVFAQPMLNFLEAGDLVLGISCSGNSPNILHAMKLAKGAGAITIGMTGQTGGQLGEFTDYCIHVPTEDVFQIEGVHSILQHAITSELRRLIVETVEKQEIMCQSYEKRAAIFLDRDGIINKNRSDYVKSWEEFEFLPGIIKPLKQLSENDHAIVIITNQSAIGRGLVDEEVVKDINNKMVEVIRTAGGRVDGIYYCPHRPEENCDCRKPQPGLLLRAAKDLNLDLANSIFIGDALTDVEAALSAGCTPIFVLTGRGKEQLSLLRQNGLMEVEVVENLSEVIHLVDGMRRQV